MDILNFVSKTYVIIVAVLYVLGALIKQASFIPDRFIPIILVGFGVGLGITRSILDNTNILDGVIQGVLCAGVAVLSNQIFKQSEKGSAEKQALGNNIVKDVTDKTCVTLENKKVEK